MRTLRDVVREVVTGAGARTRDYTYNRAGQVQTLSVNGTPAQAYFWDAKSGDIRCVTEPGYTSALCDGDGSAQPGLRDWYKFDPLDRLKAFKSYRSQDTIDSSYIYDAFDRVSSETQSHNGGPARTSDFSYLGISEEVSSETQRGSSASKRFSYDVSDQRVGATITTSSTQDYSIARNPHGDTSLLVDDGGSLRASYAYKPYGQLDLSLARDDVNPTDTYNPFRFNDKRFDTGSRSIDMGARRYEPDDGRFLQQDFFRDANDDFELSLDPATENRYGFAGGNPVNFFECDGHKVGPGGGGTQSCAGVKRSFFILGHEDAILIIKRRTGKGGPAGRTADTGTATILSFGWSVISLHTQSPEEVS